MAREFKNKVEFAPRLTERNFSAMIEVAESHNADFVIKISVMIFLKEF